MSKKVIDRVLKAPLAMVWELWTTPEGLGSWYGPKGFTVRVERFDLEVGGVLAYTMFGPTMERRVTGTIVRLDPPHVLAWEEPFGPHKLSTTVTFTPVAEGVRMVLELDATMPEMLEGAAMGWQGALDCLDEVLRSRVTA